ncbi:MAG: 2-oxoglutarate dehydrogenase complex dihydrolipoyllysine-residue succinyltransferase [Verrucomicrobiae bacterium]|nr:2-oxoglutarate dehydrogenase complex dihydrolipoyllysine-residue succinyltransferase [Verrucomicrobiae bacterium]
MSSELRVPPVGESITEVQVGEWLKNEGDPVRQDEPVVAIESEKATLELPAPAAGRLRSILKPRGATARVGEVIGILDTGTDSAASPEAPPPTSSAPAKQAGSGSESESAAGQGAPPRSEPPTVMPAARRVLAEAGIEPAAVEGTGPGGRITKEDAQRARTAQEGARPAGASTPTPDAPVAVASSTPKPAAVASASPVSAEDRLDETVPMSPLRRTVARRLVEAQSTMALLTTFNEIDMSSVSALRKRFQEAFTQRHGVKLGFMSFFVKAVIEALKDTPQLNAEVRDQSIVYHHYYDIGVAIGGGKGLVVPVLRNAERLGFAEIEKTIADFGARARDGRLKPEELQGGTFTLSNGGIYGSLLSTPIVNPPQSGILGMHAIQDRPVAVDGQVVIRPMMYVALTYDHRIVDGREAVTFLKRIKDILETPARLLLEA